MLSAIVVTSLADNTAVDGQITLREAIQAANTNLSVDGSVAGSGADVITFGAGLNGTIALSLGQLTISETVTITGNGAANTIIDAQTTSGIFDITNTAGDVTLNGLTLRNGRRLGGSNSSFSGGAVRSLSTGTLEINQSMLSGNRADYSGGAIYTQSGNLTVSKSTLSGNSSGIGGGAISTATYGSGGGLISVSQSTLSGNLVTGSSGLGGGAIFNGGNLFVSQSTITGNQAPGSVGGGISTYFGVTFHNSIIAGNSDSGFGPDLVRRNGLEPNPRTSQLTNTLLGTNMGSGTSAPTVGSTPDANGNFIGGAGANAIDPRLGPLRNNGGLTLTHALLPGSLAIDHGNNVLAVDANGVPLTLDQRGTSFPRIVNATVDMGAYEGTFIIVSTNVDESDGNFSAGDLSLREAISISNASIATIETIGFAPSTNGLPFNLTLGQLVISQTVTMIGNGSNSTIIDAQTNARIFEMTSSAGDVTLDGMTLKNGRTTGSGANFDDTTFGGGAVRWLSSGTLTVIRSTLSGNSTTGNRAGGGAILARQGTLNIIQSALSGNSTAGINSEGGAISAHLGSLQVVNSTLSNNATTGVDSEGGAIFAVFGNLTVSQSTLSGNTVSNVGAFGGAIFTQQGVVLVSQSTITENQSTSSSGGGIYTLSSPITIQNSIVAGNGDNGTAPDIRKSADIDDTFTVTNSLIGRNNGTGLTATSGSTPDGSGNFIGGATVPTAIQPLLAPLADRGGSTLTHALLAGSLAIDSGSNALAVDVTNSNAMLTTDQRGSIFARIMNGTVDMGAYELFTGPLVVSTTKDEFDSDFGVTDLSLREAIALANGSPGANTITFDANRTNGVVFNLSLGQMTITDTITISGNAPANTIIDAQQLSRIFDITGAAGDVTLNELTLKNGRTTDNGSTFGGGAIRAMSSGTLTINRSRISGNSTIGSSANGGAIFTNSGKVVIGACTIAGNVVEGYNANGGALYTASGMVMVSQTILSQNTAAGTFGNGGAICSQSGTVKLYQNTFSENSTAGAESRGGAVATISGALTVSQCTFSHNTTTGFSGDGGAIFSFSGSVTISQSTLSGNRVTGDEAQGGAVHVYNGPLNVSQSTVTDNHTTKSAAGGIFSYAAPITIKNSIIAGNSDDGTAPDVRKSPTDSIMVSNSLIGNNTGSSLPATGNVTPGVNGNFIGGAGASAINPLLSPLQNNGGPTLTHALLTGSLAINRGSNALAVDVTNGNAILTNDQRGPSFARIVNSTVDMGALEGTFIVVSTTTDELDSDFSPGDLSLREAIMLSNASGNPNEGFTFAASTNGTPFNLTLGQLTISANVTITGNGAANTIIDAQTDSRIFDIAANVTVTLNGLALRNGRTFGTNVPNTASTFSGGAIRSSGKLTINQSTLTGNSTSGFDAQGGAIYNSGQLFVNQSTLSANTTTGNGSHGGAIFSAIGALTVTDTTLSGNSATGTGASGGAIYVLRDEVTINRSTISGNSASQGGGGIFFVGTNVINFNRLIVMQSTISGNSSLGTTAPGGGGGIGGQFGEVFLLQSTVTANVSNHPNGGGGIYLDSSPAIIRNSIIAGNIAAEFGPDIRQSPDLNDQFAIHNSLVGRHNGLRASLGQVPDINGNYIGGDTPATAINPLLAPLANNGGRTQTHALQLGSPAIDHGLNSWAVDPTQSGSQPFTSDQRGQPFTRILDSDGKGATVVDIGAFESTGVRLLSPDPNAFTARPTLQWSPVAGATSYNIHVNNQSTGVAAYYTSTATGTSQTVNADFGIGAYRIWIQPVFSTGPGNWSAPRDIFILTSAVWQPMSRVQLVSRPTFSWMTLPGAVKYDLWIDNFSTGQRQLVRQDLTGTSYPPPADLPMGLYRAWVRGIDAAGIHAAWSVLQEALVVPSVIPIGPLSGTFDRTPTFSWNPVTGAASYELYVRNQTTGAMVINGTSTAATNFTPASNLTDGPYRWWTLAVSPANIGPIKSGGSNPIDIFVGGRPTIIAPVAGSSTSDRTPTFSWRAVDGAASYQLSVSRTSAPQANVISQTGLTSTSFTPATNLTAGNYRAWVRAVSTTAELSPWSIEVNFTVTATAPTIDVADTDWKLTGLLKSALVQPDAGDTETSLMRTVKHPQSEATAHDPDFEVATQTRPASLFVRSDQTVRQLHDLDVDRLMAEFALHEFTAAVISPL